MIQEGSLVQFVNMDYEYGTGFNKFWLEGAVGVVTKYTKVTNINDGHISELCTVRFLTPVVSAKDTPLTSYSGIHVQNLVEIERKPITTSFTREAITLLQETEDNDA